MSGTDSFMNTRTWILLGKWRD